MSKPLFERRVYTIDDKTWLWNVRENLTGEELPRLASGSADSPEAARAAAAEAVEGWLRSDAFQAAREASAWEPVLV